MKIGVIGIGGVGSLISTRLSTTNNQIFCFGSRDSNEYLLKKGVSIESNFYGNSTYIPKQIIEKEDKLDLVFITLKGTKLESALENYRYLFNKNTITVSLLNGLGHRETIRQNFGLKLIVGTIGSLEISLNDKRIAIHKTNNAPTVEIATSENNLKEDLKFVNDLLNRISIKSKIFEKEDMVIWRKLTRLTVISTITSMFNKNIGFLRNNPKYRELILDLIYELCLISKKIGKAIDEKQIVNAIDFLPYNLETSMQKDINSGKPSEIDYILKAPLNYGLKEGLNLPKMSYCYEFLKAKIKKGNFYAN